MGIISTVIGAVTGSSSSHWKQWVSVKDEKRCIICAEMTGKIYPINQIVWPDKLHAFCRCEIETLKKIIAGTLTTAGKEGADYWLVHYGILPDCYATKEQLRKQGWQKGMSVSDVAPGQMVGGNVYYNRNGHLPSEQGRIWYEADFDYQQGSRNGCRILYSNDGLIFASFDHYATFYEIA